MQAERGLEVLNQQLHDLAKVHGRGDIDFDGYRRKAVCLLRAFESEGDDPLATHPGLPPVQAAGFAAKSSLRKWLWLVPVVIALGFLIVLAVLLS